VGWYIAIIQILWGKDLSDMYYGFIDFEFNQGKSDKREEIISIGCVILDEEYKEVERFYSLCKPVVHTVMDKHVSDITGITQEDIDAAKSFSEVSVEFAGVLDKYPEIVFHSWGGDDFPVLRNTCKMNSCKILLKRINGITNIQNISTRDILYNGNPAFSNTKSLDSMIRFYNLPRLEAHNALNDASMLASIFRENKVRGKYDFKTNSFETEVSSEDLFIANKFVYGERLKENRNKIRHLESIYGLKASCKLDGELYHYMEPYISQPLFTTKRRRKYDRFTIKAEVDKENMCFFIYVISEEYNETIRFEMGEYSNFKFLMKLVYRKRRTS
jgi:DNA polymerase III epsilon subunit-like protein